ncbi:MAG: hypothetical protein GVY36_03140 [Verrucomicrobia bacterium]|jgi:hypothetical protein|nr:hypothetical protein [Verrucomicrobiota bacterium]
MKGIKMSACTKLLSSVAILGVLSACSSSSPSVEASVEERLGAIEDLNERGLASLEAENFPDEADLPGTATLTGGLAVFDEADDSSVIFGDMEVVADFENSEIDGRAENITVAEFLNECEEIEDCDVEFIQNLDGSLTLAGTIDGVDLEGEITGELTGTSFDEEGEAAGDLSALVALDADGTFVEDEQGLIAGADLEGGAEVTVTDGEESFEEELDLFGVMVVAE